MPTFAFVTAWIGVSRKSLASRISLWVVLSVVGILSITTLIGNYYVTKSIKLEESVKANGILYIVGQRIDASLVTVEIAVRNHMGDIIENIDNPEALYHITQRMLEDNPGIVGSAIAFRPNYFPDKGQWFAPYSYREGLNIHTKQLGGPDYDYHTMDWYQTAATMRDGYWSEPYFDEGGGEMAMTTYSCPLLDTGGNTIAVVTADILLDDLSKLLEVKYYENAYACLLSRNGTFISHPMKELVLRESIFSVTDSTKYPDLKNLAQDFAEGRSGMRRWNSPRYGESYIFFVPLQHTGWSMAIVCQASELFKGVRKAALFLTALFLIMLVLLTYLLRRGVHRLIAPLTTFTRAADQIAQGNLQAELPVIHSQDEMQQLHHSFSTMQQSLAQQMEELKQVNEAKGRIEGELKVARDIQQSMLPKPLNSQLSTLHSQLDIYGHLSAAKEVGGDFYDFFIRDEKLFFCIGDVSGKGVPAALVMATALSQFRNIAVYEDDLQKIIKSINKTACTDNETAIFVTFFMGVLDLRSEQLRYVNAGHNKPFFIGDSISELPAKPNLPLGVDENAPYKVRECTMQTGTMLFLYTDGLTEARNTQREQFGIERVISQLKNGVDSKTQIDKMTQAVQKFVGDAAQSDDLTMLAIRVKSEVKEELKGS